jgi:hypothetical protein
MENMIEHLGGAIDRNYERWPIIGQYVWPNYDWNNTSYLQEFDYLKNWMIARLNWMDDNITSTTGLFDTEGFGSNLQVSPNPLSTQLNIQLAIEEVNSIDIEIIDLLGKKVFSSDYYPDFKGDHSIIIDLPQINNGYYILIVKQKGRVIATHKLMVQH